jgi:predicted  nucleic acid-binding Zn-ribbon protein
MKVTQAKYRRTFNLGDNETETIELTASIEANESETQVLSELYEKTVGIKGAMQNIRDFKNQLKKFSLDIGQLESQIQNSKTQATTAETQITLSKNQEEKEAHEKSIATANENIEKTQKEIEGLWEKHKAVKIELDKARKQFEDGVLYVN